MLRALWKRFRETPNEVVCLPETAPALPLEYVPDPDSEVLDRWQKADEPDAMVEVLLERLSRDTVFAGLTDLLAYACPEDASPGQRRLLDEIEGVLRERWATGRPAEHTRLRMRCIDNAGLSAPFGPEVLTQGTEFWEMAAVLLEAAQPHPTGDGAELARLVVERAAAAAGVNEGTVIRHAFPEAPRGGMYRRVRGWAVCSEKAGRLPEEIRGLWESSPRHRDQERGD